MKVKINIKLATAIFNCFRETLRIEMIRFKPVIANAILDRVLHHAHVINITGNSYRLKDYYIDERTSESVHK